MEGFIVNTTNVNNCANDIQGYGDRIKDLQDSVRSIRLGMRHKLSAREQIDRTLRGIEERMLDEAVLMSSLDQALEHIAEAYRSTERKLVTEGIRRSAGGQAVTEQQQAMMDQYMQAAIFDILQEDQFSQEAWENASIEERKEILNSFLDRMEKEMGISLEDIQFRSGEDLGYNGAYNYADNYIALNEEILNSGDPSGAMTTLMHEARHAYQHAACENPDQFLVTADTIQGWQDSSDNYKSYLQDGKYSDILSEIDAHDFAGQELKKGYVSLAGGIGDGAEMYQIVTYKGLWEGFKQMVGWDQNMQAAEEEFAFWRKIPVIGPLINKPIKSAETIDNIATKYVETADAEGIDAANAGFLYEDIPAAGVRDIKATVKADVADTPAKRIFWNLGAIVKESYKESKNVDWKGAWEKDIEGLKSLWPW